MNLTTDYNPILLYQFIRKSMLQNEEFQVIKQSINSMINENESQIQSMATWKQN